MKLEPKAKPVRIRIKSGGEEHTTLSSLRSNFVIKDVRALMDGALTLWLRQQGENELADIIDELKSKGAVTEFQICKAFFPSINGNDMLSVLYYWLENGYAVNVNTYLCSLDVWMIIDKEYVDIAKRIGFPVEDKLLDLAKDPDSLSDETCFEVGKRLYEKLSTKNVGIKCLALSFKRGDSRVKEYAGVKQSLMQEIKDYFRIKSGKQNDNSRTKSEKQTKLIFSSDFASEYKRASHTLAAINQKYIKTPEDENISKFYVQLINIYNVIENPRSSEKPYIPYLYTWLQSPEIFNAAKFVLAITDSSTSEIRRKLEGMKNYPLAKDYLYRRDTLLPSTKYNFAYNSRVANLKFFIQHLLEIINYEG